VRLVVPPTVVVVDVSVDRAPVNAEDLLHRRTNPARASMNAPSSERDAICGSSSHFGCRDERVADLRGRGKREGLRQFTQSRLIECYDQQAG
jgi:hypothetical protein